MNINYKQAVVISRTNPSLNFGQTINVLSATSTNAVVRAHSDEKKYTVDISEIWLSEKAHDYEAYNNALSKIKSWPWQLQ